MVSQLLQPPEMLLTAEENAEVRSASRCNSIPQPCHHSCVRFGFPCP